MNGYSMKAYLLTIVKQPLHLADIKQPWIRYTHIE